MFTDSDRQLLSLDFGSILVPKAFRPSVLKRDDESLLFPTSLPRECRRSHSDLEDMGFLDQQCNQTVR